MAATTSSPAQDSEESGFTAAERSAMKERSTEVRRARTAKGAAKAAADAAAQEQKIAELEGLDRELAELVVRAVAAAAPQLVAKTWYGMPAWNPGDGKSLLFFKPAAKFGDRYATLGFNDTARLDDGDLWAKEFALVAATEDVERRVTDLVRRAAQP